VARWDDDELESKFNLKREHMKFKKDRRGFIKTVGVGMGMGMAISQPGQGATSAKLSSYPDLAALRAAHQRLGMIEPDKTYRMMEWESHTWPQETRYNMNLDAAMAASKATGAEAMGLYTQDTWGYAFYPTDVGRVVKALNSTCSLGRRKRRTGMACQWWPITVFSLIIARWNCIRIGRGWTPRGGRGVCAGFKPASTRPIVRRYSA
jgi:hypothetical protein